MAKKENIKKRQFNVPKDFIGTFLNELAGSDLSYNIVEYDNSTEELIVKVFYSPEQRDDVMDLIETLDEFIAEMNEDDFEGEDGN